MKLVVGLGNPGKKYVNTRHNVGFDLLDAIADKNNIDFSLSKCKSIIGKGRIAGEPVILAKPQTYMNLSGEAILSLMSTFKLKPQNITVIYDDFALELGQIKLRMKGSAGGHNGIKSIISCIGQNFNRVRVGIGSPKDDTVDFVLSKFSADQEEILGEVFNIMNDCVKDIIKCGVNVAMNKYNGLHKKKS